MAKTPQTAAKTPETEPTAPAAAPVTRATTLPPSQVQFDTSQLKSSYCNVTNGTSTREEVVLNFGLNDSWDMGNERLKVHLQHRIVMSPHAAKRLRDMMVRLIDEHEKRHGPLGE
jgi:hypothetical protein